MSNYLQNNSYKTLLTSLQYDRPEAVYTALDGSPVLKAAVQK